ncbi:MAG: hypothetical protein ACLGXA_20995 [Acidobacteriota bacterium]
MKKRSYVFLAALFIAANLPSISQTLVVGTCKPHQKSYATIQAAVNAAPANATIQVCPGTYAEQILITVPLTLKGVSIPPLDNPTIVAPAAGLSNTLPTGPAAMIAVATHGTPGSVNIQGIVLDGRAMNTSTNQEISGISYLSTSGVISNTVIEYLGAAALPTGLWIENDDPWPVTVTAKGNVIHSLPYGVGIAASSGPSSSTLGFQMRDNMIWQALDGAEFSTNGGGVYASANIIEAYGSGMRIYDATVADRNVITVPGEAVGIFVEAKGSSITGNTINTTGWGGISIDASSNNVSVSSNKIVAGLEELSSETIDPHARGIVNGSPTSNLQSNTILNFHIGIDLGCVAANVTGNTIFHSTIGIGGVPAGTTLTNNFVDVATPQAICQ